MSDTYITQLEQSYHEQQRHVVELWTKQNGGVQINLVVCLLTGNPKENDTYVVSHVYIYTSARVCADAIMKVLQFYCSPRK